MRAKAELAKVTRHITDSDLVLIKLLGLPDKVISTALKLDNGASIRMKISRLAVKLGVENRTAILIRALQLGLVTPSQLVYRDFDVGANIEKNTS